MVADRGSTAFSLPLCSDCAPLQRKSYRLARSGSWAQWTVAVAVALLAPLIWPGQAPWWPGLMATLSLGLLALVNWGRRVAEGLPPSMAAWSGNDLLIVRPEFGARVAEYNGLEWREVRASAWMRQASYCGLLFAAAAGSYYASHPRLRVLNLGPAEVAVLDSNQLLGRVPAVGYESPLPVSVYRVARGTHDLVARLADGTELQRSTIRAEAFREHLWVIGGQGYCLWLEHTGYGRSTGEQVSGLGTEGPFWVLGQAIDTWFAPNPAPLPSDTRSSGGSLTALRYARCSDAPSASTAIAR